MSAPEVAEASRGARGPDDPEKVGWDAGIRTPISRVRVCCPTVERRPSNEPAVGENLPKLPVPAGAGQAPGVWWSFCHKNALESDVMNFTPGTTLPESRSSFVMNMSMPAAAAQDSCIASVAAIERSARNAA